MRTRWTQRSLVVLILAVPQNVIGVPAITTDELRSHVYELADPAMEGRGLGTAGIESAAAYIADEFARYGLKPGGPEESFFQPFDANLRTGKIPTRNVVGILPGKNTLPDPYIVLGAHYDHLGYEAVESDKSGDPVVLPGADDNASGVAALLELAEHFSARGPLERTLIFVAFSGEESGLLGSAYFVDHPDHSLEQTLAMMNMDAVGRPDPGEVTVFSNRSAAEFDSLLEAANTDSLLLKREGRGVGPSDHGSFIEEGVPALHFFGTAHLDYHRPTDTPEKLNYTGLEDIAELVARMVEDLAAIPHPLTFRKPADRSHGHGGPGKGAYLGIVPDFGGSDQGLALRGIREESPAERAGLQAGDVIVGFGGAEVEDIGGLFKALSAHAPGDTVQIEILRGKERLELSAVLADRNPSE